MLSGGIESGKNGLMGIPTFHQRQQPKGKRFTTRETLLEVIFSFKAGDRVRRNDTYKLMCQDQIRTGEPDFTYCSPEPGGQPGLNQECRLESLLWFKYGVPPQKSPGLEAWFPAL